MRTRTVLFRSGGITGTLELNGVQQILRDKGLDASGDVQQFHTKNVLKRIKRYMPFRTGKTYKLTQVQTDIKKPEIVTNAPWANVIFRGKVMIDPKINAAGFMTPEGWRSRKHSIKVLTDRNVEYTKTKNPAAGPRWDKALVAAEGRLLVAELQRFINRR